MCATVAGRHKEETIYSFLNRPDDQQETFVCIESKCKHRNSLLSLIIAINILLLSIITYVTTYTILTYIQLRHPKIPTNHPFLQIAPIHSKSYKEYLRKLRLLNEGSTHPKGEEPKRHNFEFKISDGTIAYRISNKSYLSTQIWREDYDLFRRNSAKFGIIYCDNWKDHTDWQPLHYNCAPTLKLAVPLNMLDNNPSSNAGINFLLNDEVSHPTLLAAAAIMAALFFVWCAFQCCCQVTTCGGTAIALQRTRKSTKSPELRSFDTQLNQMLAAATQSQPRAGHV